MGRKRKINACWALHSWLYFFLFAWSTKGRMPYELEIILTGKRKEHGGDLALLVI